MTKPQLLQEIATKAACTKVEADRVLTAFTEVIQEQVLESGDSISLPGLGTFKQKQSEPRTGRNPRTGEAVNIAAKTKVAFSAAPAMKK